MTLGEKLRQARVAAGLSQRQLCGQHMTRNQLSMLENNHAMPSLETLYYLAGQLGKPVSYFLEGEQSRLLESAAFNWNEPEAALAVLATYMPDGTVSDDVISLLQAMASLAAARQAIEAGQIPYAARLLSRAAEQKSRFTQPDLAGAIAATQASLDGAGEENALLAYLTPGLLALARVYLTQGKAEASLAVLALLPENQGAVIRGKALHSLGRYAQALAVLKDLPPSKDLLLLLEDCCQQQGDFQSAYGYARQLRTLGE